MTQHHQWLGHAAIIMTLGACLAAVVSAAATNALPDFDRWWDYDHPEQTEKRFRELLGTAEKSGDLSYLLQLQTQIARCEGLQGRFDQCHRTLDEVEKRLGPQVPVAQVRYWLERGRAFNSQDQPERAKPLFVMAWDLARSIKETNYAIDAAHMIAIAEPEPVAQIEWNQRALELAEHDPKQAGWLVPIYNNLGEAYRAHKEYAKALDCFERRAQWFRDRGKEPDIFNLKDIARMNRLLGKPQASLPVIEPIAKDLESKHKPNGYIDAEYGQCLAALGRGDEAKPWLRRAYAELSKDPYMVRYEPDELDRIKRLAGIGQ